jgi:hypothetical protein
MFCVLLGVLSLLGVMGLIVAAIVGAVLLIGWAQSRQQTPRHAENPAEIITDPTPDLDAILNEYHPHKAAPAEFKRAQAEEKAEHKRQQARQDVDFYASQRQRLMTLYEIAENEYNNAATDKARMIAGNRLMSYDDRLRRIERQMENAYFTANN